MMIKFALLAAPIALIAAPAAAQLRPLVAPLENVTSAVDGVDVFLLNEGREAAPIEAPETINTIARDGTSLTLSLIRSTADAGPIPAGGFAKLRYRIAPLAPAPNAPSAQVQIATVAPVEQQTTSARGSASGFLDRLRPYEPTYGVIGGGSDSAKLQFSFAVRPIGGTGIASHINFAYTQTIFWALDRPSGPIRTSTYSPEIFLEYPLGGSFRVAAGYRHDSNGGGPLDSVDLNRIFVRANKTFDLGDHWRLDLAPQAWFFVGGFSNARNVDRFYGYAGINASIEQRNGLKIAVNARGNPVSQRGGAELFVSYPIRQFGVGDVGLYLFAQGFSGYGEALTDYDIRRTTGRIGIAFTR